MATRRLRILSLIEGVRSVGGAERFAVGLAEHLSRDGFEAWMCSTRGFEPEVVDALRSAGVKHVHLGRRSKWDIHKMAGLLSLLQRESFDVLHAHMFGSNVWGTLAGRVCRVPVVIAHEQTWSYEGHPARRCIDGRVIGRLATRFVAVSSADAARMVRLERVPAEKVVMIPNAYVPRGKSHRGDIRGEIGISSTTPLIGVAAVLRPQKALHVLIDAHARLLERLPHAHLVIAGEGRCAGELERRVLDLGLKGHVHFLGRREDVDAILRSVDVAAMSSDFEGTPLFAFECMANRTPLVATRVGGLPEIVADGRTGVLVPPRNPDALAEALRTLLVDPALRKRLADAAAVRLDDFTIDTISKRFATLYEQLVAQAKRAPV